MWPSKTGTAWVLTALFFFGLVGPTHAEVRTVPPGPDDLQSILDKAAEGDTIVLLSGLHRGPIRLTRKISLVGEKGAVVTGSNEGSVVTVLAPEAVVQGLIVRGSGTDLETMDSGIFVEQSATGAVIEDNRLEGNLFGIYLHGAGYSIAQRNQIIGFRQVQVSEAGNGISVWNAPGAKILDNDIRFGRDGVLVTTSRKNVISGNSFRDLRFAVHYMYADDGEITGNLSIGDNIGYALMYSHRLTVRGNFSKQDRDHGLLFNYANGSEITDNVVEGGLLPSVRWASPWGHGDEHETLTSGLDPASSAENYRIGPEKCVFIYNANNNRFHGNWFEGCDIGIHFTAGSEGNEFVGNAFIGNRNQVKYVGTRFLDWSTDGRGNYWSDNPGFDLNGDGIADTAYRPNDLIDKVLWIAPQAKVLMNSPAVQVIRWAQSQFPALLPGGVIDSHPLIAPPVKPVLKARSTS
jgi:nitrous oxidase accessory protein